MNDLIDREQAIKAIEDLQDCYNGFSDFYDKACIIGVLEELPPVEKTGKMLINLIDARRGLHEKCVELFADKNIAEQIYRKLCEGIDDCEEVLSTEKTGK